MTLYVGGQVARGVHRGVKRIVRRPGWTYGPYIPYPYPYPGLHYPGRRRRDTDAVNESVEEELNRDMKAIDWIQQ